MRTEVELSRSEILSRAEGIAITMLPDMTVVDTSEDAESAARALVRFWENEAHRIGETICYAGDGPIVAHDQLSELRTCVLDSVQRRIAFAQAQKYNDETDCAHSDGGPLGRDDELGDGCSTDPDQERF